MEEAKLDQASDRSTRSRLVFANGELTCVGALLGRGRTPLMLQAMYDAAANGMGVGCISLEMRGRQL